MTDVSGAVDFLIVTPLEEERDALLRLLPNVRMLPPDDRDTRVYYRSRLKLSAKDFPSAEYQLVVTALVNIGVGQAAATTADAIRRWSPRYVLVVGIAGGVRTAGVSLGDVLLADQIVDYTLQKHRAEQAMEIRWQVNPVDTGLLERARAFRSNRWHRKAAANRPSPGTPQRHVGPIASGDQVIASDTLLSQYRAPWPKLIGVEMEAAGVARIVSQARSRAGFFMIRGVSDLADPAKDSSAVGLWRQYACDVAAAYAVDFLRSGPIVPTDAAAAPVVRPSDPAAVSAPPMEPRRDLIERQRRLLSNGPLFHSRILLSPKRGAFLPSGLIQATLELPSGRVPLRDHLAAEFNTGSRSRWILLIGEAGAGKTTAMFEVFEVACHASQPWLPLYVDALTIRRLDTSTTPLLAAIAQHHNVPLEAARAEAGTRVALLVDGLDELAPDVLVRFVRRVQSAGTDIGIVCCTARSEFYWRSIVGDSFLDSQFDVVGQIAPWDLKQMTAFANGVLPVLLGSAAPPSAIGDLIQRLTVQQELLRNPLRLTMFLWALCNAGGMAPLESVVTSFELYQRFIRLWLSSQEARLPESAATPSPCIASTSELVRLHETVAFRLHHLRERDVDLVECIRTAFPDIPLQSGAIDALLADPRMATLFAVEDRRGLQGRLTARGYCHESIGDFLAARYIVRVLCDETSRMGTTVINRFNGATNAFVIDGISAFDPQTAHAVAESLEALLGKALAELDGGVVTPQQRLLIEQMLYYIGRLPLCEVPHILEAAFEQEDPYVRRSAAISAILLESAELEAAYLERLTAGSIDDGINRSVDLVYFGDVQADPHEYRDVHGVSWSKVRESILARLRSPNRRCRALRLWDVRTLYLFCVSRRWSGCGIGAEDLMCVDLSQLGAQRQERASDDLDRLARGLGHVGPAVPAS